MTRVVLVVLALAYFAGLFALGGALTWIPALGLVVVDQRWWLRGPRE